MEKVKERENRLVRADSSMVDEAEVEKSFWLSRSDDWMINRKTKKIILLEFKKNLRLWGVLLQGHVEGGGDAAHPYHDRS